MSNLDVALAGFWQLARHWKQGHKSKLELSCEGGCLHMQLSAVLGHPDQPHFPHPPRPTPSFKRKSPSQVRREERRRKEATEATSVEEVAVKPSEKPAEKLVTKPPVKPAKKPVEKPANKAAETDKAETIKFNCDQCSYTNISEKGLMQHSRMKHRISQIDGSNDDTENSNITRNSCPLCSEDEYCNCGTCEECEYFATEAGFNTHIMNQHEPAEVLKSFGNKWVSEQMQFILRNPNSAQDRYQSQKWDKICA
jgi:hypothetical protein